MKSLLLGVITIFAIQSTQASACTVMPVNAIAQKNDLVAQALTKLNVSIEQVTDVQVADYDGRYIWTPMCPKGLTSQAEFTISFNDDPSHLTFGCTAVVKVSKHFIYADGMPEYTIDVVQPAICLE